MQGDASIGIGPRSAILQVALDGKADVGQLAPDLMMATRKKLNLKQGISLGGCLDTIMKPRLLRPRTGRIVGKRTIQFLVTDQIIRQILFLGWKVCGVCAQFGISTPNILDNAPVGLVHLATCKHTVESFERLASLSEKDHPSGGAVQSVSDTQKDIARLGIALLDQALQRLRQWFVARLVTLHNLVAGLADSDDVVVFVDYFQLTEKINCYLLIVNC